MLHRRQCVQSAACRILSPFQGLSGCCCQSGRSHAGSLSNITLILKLLWWFFKGVHFLWPSAFVIADLSLSRGRAEGWHYLVWLHWFSRSGRSDFRWGKEDRNRNVGLSIFSQWCSAPEQDGTHRTHSRVFPPKTPGWWVRQQCLGCGFVRHRPWAVTKEEWCPHASAFFFAESGNSCPKSSPLTWLLFCHFCTKVKAKPKVAEAMLDIKM